MFGTLADFDALIAEAHRLGLKVMIDQVLVAHLRPASLVQGKPRRAATNPKADWYVWADAKPDGTPPNNWLSIFGGSAWEWDTRRAAILPAQFPGLAAGPQLPQPRGAGRAARHRPLLAGARRRRLPPRHHQLLLPRARGCENNPPLPPDERNDRPRRRSTPTTTRTISTTRASRRTSASSSASARCSTSIRRRAAVGEVGDAQRVAGDDGRLHRRRRQAAHVLHLRLPRRRNSQRRACPRGARGLRGEVAGDGWSCWAFSNHDVDAPCHALGDGDGRPDRLSQARRRAAAVAARLGLPLPGRGARADRGRTRLRGSARSLRHPLLAGVQGPRRLPHADGVGGGADEWRLLDRQALAAGAEASISRRPSMCSRATRLRCSSTIGACSPSAAPIRRWPRATSTSSQARATCSPSPRREGNEQIVCVFNLGRQARAKSTSAADHCSLCRTRVFRRRPSTGSIAPWRLRRLVRAHRLNREESLGGNHGRSHAETSEEVLRQSNILHGIDLDIKSGEFIVFVGPSGCGKSTLLRLDRRARGNHRRRAPDRRRGGQRRAAVQARHRHGVPVLCALSAHDRLRQHGASA